MGVRVRFRVSVRVRIGSTCTATVTSLPPFAAFSSGMSPNDSSKEVETAAIFRGSLMSAIFGLAAIISAASAPGMLTVMTTSYVTARRRRRAFVVSVMAAVTNFRGTPILPATCSPIAAETSSICSCSSLVSNANATVIVTSNRSLSVTSPIPVDKW